MKGISRFLLVLLVSVPPLGWATARPSVAVQAAADIASAQALLGGEDLEIGFLCPMHPHHTSEEPGKCPICGMALVKGALYDMRDYRLEMKTVPAVPKAGEKVTVTFTVFHPGTNEPIRNFELVHDRSYHLFVISRDMDFFEHIHPQQTEEGSWSIDVTLPKPGYYELLSDFAPSGGASQFLRRSLVTADYSGDLMTDSARLMPDAIRTQTVGNLKADVSYDPFVLRAGSYGHLIFRLTRADTGEPVRELQPYLGAFGHTLIMSEDMVDYVHSHPVEMLSPALNISELRGGPDIMFDGLMPKAGRYRAWTQFLYQDKLHTFTTTFEVFEVGQRVAR
jgi:hypothetical protein